MFTALIVFDLSKEVCKLTERYDFIFNITNGTFNPESSTWYKIHIRNDFEKKTFIDYKKLTDKLKPLEHGNNIYNYYFQIVENIKKDILDKVAGRKVEFFIENYFFYPTIYFTGIKEQSSFPLFLTGSCFGESIFTSFQNSGLSIRKKGKKKGKFQTLLRNRLLALCIYLKLLHSIFAIKNNFSLKQLRNYTGKVILARNLHQYREAKKVQALTESEVLLLPSLHSVGKEHSDCHSLKKTDLFFELVNSFKESCCKPSYDDTNSVIEVLEANSSLLPNYLFYKRLLKVVDNQLSRDTEIISLEQLSPQAVSESEILGSTRACVGIQTTLIELKSYYLLSPFRRFLLSDSASEKFFSKLGYVNAKYDGSINYSYIKKQFTKRRPEKITVLTQAYNTVEFKRYLEQVLEILRISPNYIDVPVQILVHPREAASDYNYLLSNYKNLELVDSDHTLLKRISESIFVITRTTSLIQECVYMNVPVFSLLLNDSDIGLAAKVSYLDACIKCYSLHDFSKYIGSDIGTCFYMKREKYLATTKEVVFEKLD